MTSKFYKWIYRQLCWASVEQACGNEPMPWYIELAREWLPNPYDYGQLGAARVSDGDSPK